MVAKKVPTFELGDQIVVVWDDAFVQSGGYWREVSDVYETKNIRTIGYYLHTTDRFVTIAQSIGHGEDAEVDQYGGIFSIPAGFVVSVDKIG